MPSRPHSETGFPHQARPATVTPPRPSRYRTVFPAVWVPPRGMDTQNDNVVGVRRPDTFALTDHSGRHIRVDAITNQLQSDKVLRRAKCGVSADFPGGRALCPSVILSPQAKDLGPASRQ